jgi:hypothetical protein
VSAIPRRLPQAQANLSTTESSIPALKSASTRPLIDWRYYWAKMQVARSRGSTKPAACLRLQSRSLSNLFNSSSLTYGIQAPIQWNLLNGDRVHGNIQVQTEKTQQWLLMYENQVLLAVEEVENAIVGFNLNLNRQRNEYLPTLLACTRRWVVAGMWIKQCIWVLQTSPDFSTNALEN